MSDSGRQQQIEMFLGMQHARDFPSVPACGTLRSMSRAPQALLLKPVLGATPSLMPQSWLLGASKGAAAHGASPPSPRRLSCWSSRHPRWMTDVHTAFAHANPVRTRPSPNSKHDRAEGVLLSFQVVFFIPAGGRGKRGKRRGYTDWHAALTAFLSAAGVDTVELVIYLDLPCRVRQLLVTVAHGLCDTTSPLKMAVKVGRYINTTQVRSPVWTEPLFLVAPEGQKLALACIVVDPPLFPLCAREDGPRQTRIPYALFESRRALTEDVWD